MVWLFYLPRLNETYTQCWIITITTLNIYWILIMCQALHVNMSDLLYLSILKQSYSFVLLPTHWRWGKWHVRVVWVPQRHTTSNQWLWDLKPRLKDSQGVPILLATTLHWLLSTNRLCTFFNQSLQLNHRIFELVWLRMAPHLEEEPKTPY